ncbi:MAG: hypothetical protein MHM6MM_005544 [Cercozoa sp. M6MM]
MGGREYGSVAYWEARYDPDRAEELVGHALTEDEVARAAAFDWYCDYDDIRDELLKVLEDEELSQLRVFVPGCGNSAVSFEAAEDFGHVLSVDFSPTCIRKMSELAETKGLSDKCVFQVADVTDCSHLGTFDVVLDKGTFDAVLCSEECETAAAKMMWEMHKMLRPGGFMVVCTHGSPDRRLGLFRGEDMPPMPKWNDDIYQARAGNFHFYALRKPATCTLPSS